MVSETLVERELGNYEMNVLHDNLNIVESISMAEINSALKKMDSPRLSIESAEYERTTVDIKISSREMLIVGDKLVTPLSLNQNISSIDLPSNSMSASNSWTKSDRSTKSWFLYNLKEDSLNLELKSVYDEYINWVPTDDEEPIKGTIEFYQSISE